MTPENAFMLMLGWIAGASTILLGVSLASKMQGERK